MDNCPEIVGDILSLIGPEKDENSVAEFSQKDWSYILEHFNEQVGEQLKHGWPSSTGDSLLRWISLSNLEASQPLRLFKANYYLVGKRGEYSLIIDGRSSKLAVSYIHGDELDSPDFTTKLIKISPRFDYFIFKLTENKRSPEPDHIDINKWLRFSPRFPKNPSRENLALLLDELEKSELVESFQASANFIDKLKKKNAPAWLYDVFFNRWITGELDTTSRLQLYSIDDLFLDEFLSILDEDLFRFAQGMSDTITIDLATDNYEVGYISGAEWGGEGCGEPARKYFCSTGYGVVEFFYRYTQGYYLPVDYYDSMSFQRIINEV